MDFQTLITLVLIGLAAGIASGFIGIGGGIVIIPALIYFLGLTQFQAQGVSLTLMLPPIGVLAFYNYYQETKCWQVPELFQENLQGTKYLDAEIEIHVIRCKLPVLWTRF